MKKKGIFTVSLLSMLIFLSFVNTSVAAPPSYVGIKTGDEFIWTASFNMANINTTGIALFGLANWTFMYEYALEFLSNNTGVEVPLIAGSGLKLVMTNVSDEIPHPFYTGMYGSGLYFDQYVAYEPNNWTLMFNSSGSTFPMMYLFDPSLFNATNIMYSFQGLPIFVPIGYPFPTFVAASNLAITANPYLNGNVTIQVHGNGMQITLNPTYLAWVYSIIGLPFTIGSLSNVVFTATWNSNGVFEYGSIAYGGITIATAQLETGAGGDEIPGYEIATIIGVSLVTILAVIYIKRKKKM